MIEAVNLTKRFDDIVAVDHISATIKDGSVFGLIGTNGAGKSTFLRLASGVLKPDEGCITIDGHEVFENTPAKKRFFYISDEQYFFNNSTPLEIMHYYRHVYEGFNEERFHKLMKNFGLDEKRKIHTFSKGMKRQAFLILALCANTDYLLCDEVFDGLDPVVTEAMKNLFGKEIQERALTVVVAAHKLQDLEDFCNEIGILHKGGLLLAGDMREKAGTMTKIQCVFEQDEPLMAEHPSIVRCHRDGCFTTVIARGKKEEALENIRQRNPIFYKEVPMTLEEIFMTEMEENGYDIRKVLQ